MLKQLAIAIAAASLTACGGGDPVDPAVGAIGDWNCKVKTMVNGKVHAQVFIMKLTKERTATLISERSYKEPGVSIKYEQTSTGIWKTGGMKFGLDDVHHSIKVLKAGGRTMRAMSEAQHTPYARTLLRDSLKPIEKIRYEITLIDQGRFRLAEGDVEDPDTVKTNCTRVKELTEEQIAAAEAKKKSEEEGTQNTTSALFN